MPSLMNALAPGERLLLRTRPHPLAYLQPLLLFAITLYPAPLLRAARLSACLTDRHIIIQQGDRRTRWRHNEIESFSVRQGPLGVLFDYGTVTLTHKDGTKLRLAGLCEPRLWQQEIEGLIELAVLGRRLDAALQPEMRDF